MTQPLHATITGASISQSRWIPRWPRRISSWCESSVFWVPIELASRPDENDFPSPRQTMARTSGRRDELVEDREQLRVHVVVERVVLVGVVVRDRRDRAVDVEPDPHGCPPFIKAGTYCGGLRACGGGCHAAGAGPRS